ncbi:MAG: hypothetical protein QM831_46625 [Kofleriaceae bacterium]
MLAVLLSPTFVFGVSGGMTQAEAESSQDPDGEVGLLVRMSGRRFGVELGMTKVSAPSDGGAKQFTGLAVLDLADGRWVPQLFAGIGLDRAGQQYSSYDGTHVEVGAGLELRLDGGLVLGARFHIGDRWSDDAGYINDGDCIDCGLYDSHPLSDGQYRTLDAYAGVRF